MKVKTHSSRVSKKRIDLTFDVDDDLKDLTKNALHLCCIVEEAPNHLSNKKRQMCST